MEFDKKVLEEDYKSSQAFGSVHVGEKALFFKQAFRCLFIPFEEIGRVYRRVLMVGNKNSVPFENLVVEDRQGKEVASLPVPGTQAAKEVMALLEKKLPWALFVRPEKEKEDGRKKHGK